MKKQQLLESIQNFVTFHTDNYDGADWHRVSIQSDKYDNVEIIGHYGKRRIEAVTVAVDINNDIFEYDVTNEIIEHEPADGGLYKESYFTDEAAAVQSMYDTIISASKNIAKLLSYPEEKLTSYAADIPFSGVEQ